MLAALLNSFSSEENVDILLPIDHGICLIMDCGWFDLALIYMGSFPGFLNGWCFPVDRFKVTSR